MSTDDTIQLVFHDESSGSGFDVQKYVLTQNATPPADDDSSWSSWSNSQSKTVSFSSGGNGWYVHTRAMDQAGNLGTASFGPYTVALIVSAEDDLALTDEDTPSTPINVLFNDKYDRNNTPTLTITEEGAKGTAQIENDNTVVYTPSENETGTDYITYELDDNGQKATGKITISIRAVDDLPIAVEDEFDVDENATLNDDVSTNDIELDGDSRIYYEVDGPSHALSFTFNNDGTFTYLHNGDEIATDSFTYRFEDANSFSNTVAATFNVTPLNDAPEGGNVSLDVIEDVPFAFSATDFTFSDPDTGDGFNGIQIVSLPGTGTLSYNSSPVSANDMIDDVSKLKFTTAEGGFGKNYAAFSFKVKDGSDAVSAIGYSMAITALEDFDGDGTPDVDDTDDDGDGTPDNEDVFPRDPAEDTDTDGDGTGDNEDTDDDNDGTPDDKDAFPRNSDEDTDTNGDGTGDNADDDDDNDGTPDNKDAFPKDSNEDTDTDGDGTGDNTDDDDDNDGTPDDKDAFPKDSNEDTDTDGDGTGDNADSDDDGDGTPDDRDAFPKDSGEDIDSDGDGIGDNGDTDDDNDGKEDIDTDGDGTGDNVDADDDNDGIPDSEDAFPRDANEAIDTDGDGIGDNTDEDDDNDGYSDIMEDDHGTDSKNGDSNPKDTDGDGMPDAVDVDDDNDGVADDSDAFPENNKPLLRPAEAFTPNGDGINDAWMIPGIDNYGNSEIKVYNRWGHEVFNTINYRNDWEGNYRSKSDKLPPGSYMYVIDLGNGSALIKGWLFLNY